MRFLKKEMKAIIALIALFICLLPCNAHAAEDVLPKAVLGELHKPLRPIGSGTYRKFGFSVYKITLWTADGTWDRRKPYALEMRYMRDVSKDTLVDTVTDDLRDEHEGDDATVERWHQTLNNILPDIQDGDTIVALCLPDQKASPIFHNDNVLARIGDRGFIKAFFDIWLGPQADEDMRAKLLAQQ